MMEGRGGFVNMDLEGDWMDWFWGRIVGFFREGSKKEIFRIGLLLIWYYIGFVYWIWCTAKQFLLNEHQIIYKINLCENNFI